MIRIDTTELRRQTVEILRAAGATFAFLHGSTTREPGSQSPARDLDVGAWWVSDPPPSFAVVLPPGVDLTVLNTAPLELAGTIAARGHLLFDDDPVQRVRWQSTTRKIYFDERPRLERAHREFAQSVLDGR